MAWYKKLFIDEAKSALYGRTCSGSGDGSGSDSDDTQMYILVDEDGNEYPAVLVDEETTFDATANDIREGKVAATESGVTVGTKEIPSYYTLEGFTLIPAGSSFSIIGIKNYEYTKLQVIICALGTSIDTSVAAEKVSINSKVYEVGSTDVLSVVSTNSENSSINLGIINEGTSPCVMRYFTYKEEY